MSQQLDIIKLARETGVKFSFFATGLSFALLGAATQTANFKLSWGANSFEYVGWCFLLIAALAGMTRTCFLQDAYFNVARQTTTKPVNIWNDRLHKVNLTCLFVGIFCIFIARSILAFIAIH